MRLKVKEEHLKLRHTAVQTVLCSLYKKYWIPSARCSIRSVLTKCRKKKKRKAPKARSEAICLKPAQGKSYADIVATITGKVKPEELGITIKGIRKTRGGEALVEIKGENSESRKNLTEALKAALADKGTVRELLPKMSLEIRDIADRTTKEEVEGTIKRQRSDYEGPVEARLTRPSKRGQVLAVVETAKIKIGWVVCRIRSYTVIKRCFKCIGFWYITYTCKGADRTKCCYKCGSDEHLAKDCKENAKCFLCAEAEKPPEKLGHIAGSGAWSCSGSC